MHKGASIWAGHAEHHQQGRTGGASECSKALQTGSEGEHSNRLEVLDAEDWHPPKVTVIDGRRLPQTAARSDRARDYAMSTSRG